MAVAAFGSGVGLSGLLLYTIGLFVADLESDLGLSRTAYGLGLLFVSAGVGIGTITCGRLIDRFGSRAVVATGATALAAGYALLGLVVDSVPTFLGVMFAMGLLASGTGPLGYTRVVAMWFRTARGLALGLTMTGIGVSAAVVPVVLNDVITRFGWRSGFLVLAALAASAVVPVLALLREPRAVAAGSGSVATSTTLVAGGADAARVARTAFDQIVRTQMFRRLLATFFAMAMAFTGLLSHFVPMLRSMGSTPAHAATLASIIGVAVIFSRVLVGWLLDLLRPGLVAGVVCGVSTAGLLVLVAGGAPWAPVAAVALGLAIGAEIDMISYFTARYFALDGYARAYSWMYAGFVVAAGIAPLAIGASYDATGSYTATLLVCAVLTAGCTLAFLTLPAPSPTRVVDPTAQRLRPTATAAPASTLRSVDDPHP
ncbi:MULTISPECIES: MFS transporter [unclassified Rhodococcus (in: high G+C Gram-positive bacteria)]|uniref:MFS transporter n=1 Tax=unclassified Rhodococcus (in: high G+C Gram-positive bacteria) TaxID=192944 RepID=UPI0006F7B000|nr:MULTISPECIES: MFS transporter [unclassified Rhodococcus (in: high G+C Gram-positive bacteria)]